MTEPRTPRKRANGPTRAATNARIEIAPPTDIDITKDRLGSVLSERRKLLGLKLEDVADDIKIRPEYLQALEEESLEALPTTEYARLFLKSYADRLGIDISEAYALLDLCERPLGAKPQPEKRYSGEGRTLESVATSRKQSMLWVYVLAAIIAAVAVWLLLRTGGDPSDGILESPAGELTEEIVASTPPVVAEAVAPVEVVEPMLLELSFDRDTWVVLAADDDTVVNRVQQAGDVARATAMNRFLLTLGHTDGVAAMVNGKPLSPFRGRASRLSGVVITADSVEAWLDTTTQDATEETLDLPRDTMVMGP